ncbi:leucine-rich repeat domain-containing protein [Maribacter sp. IgM3_T14_3]|uniref:leucine-rich repeat domain-containing protein n=1 Tax=Maribacter sp. IgM3_T14_3 TaxID=3415140 RepID=UPI003C6F891D
MKSKIFKIAALFILITSCSKDSPTEDNTPAPIVKSQDKEIVSFKFLKEDNLNLNEDITISIDQNTLSLSGGFPFATELNGLIPTIEISPNATIVPASKAAIDLESSVEFTVTAEDGTSQEYRLSISENENEEGNVVNFSLLAMDNNDGTIFGQIHEDIVGTINEEDNTITIAIPVGTEIDELVPTITTSEFATISPQNKVAHNFSQPITYTVTSQAGNIKTYEVSLTTGLKPDRQLLMEIDALNPDNTLGWDFSVMSLNELPFVETFDNQSVRRLEFQGRNITNFPEGMSGFTRLSNLHLSSNSLDAIPNEIYEISSLDYLDLSNNNITIVDPEIANLESLTYINLGQNEISTLPDEFTTLTSLDYFHLDNNLLTQLPANIGDLINLGNFFVQNNQLTSLPESVSQLTKIWRMDVSGNNLSEFPNTILSLTNLQFLNLSDNNINSIPTEIGNLTQLIQLYLNTNNIQLLPIELGSLTQLELLVMSNNQITVFPEELNFPLLQQLHFADNPIAIFPITITNMLNLNYLRMSDTEITMIPETIDNLTNLENLFLEGTPLERIPSQIGNLENLYNLDIGRNSILTSLPTELGNLINLNRLVISNTANLRVIPAEVCALETMYNVILIKDSSDTCE